MKVRIYGGRVGFGEEWSEEFVFDCDSTERDIEIVAAGLSDDFMVYELEEEADLYDYWYEWEVL
jgi:hypothetical protein